MSDIVFTQPDRVALVEGAPVYLTRAENQVRLVEDEHGRKGLGFTPPKGQWSAWTTRIGNQSKTGKITVVAMIGCPKCGGIIYLPHTPDAAHALGNIMKMPVRVTHQIDRVGVVSPGIICPHKCGFERGQRDVKLVEWDRERRPYAAQMRHRKSNRIYTVYTHAYDQREACMHLAPGPQETAVTPPAPVIGWLGDEKTGVSKIH